MSAVNALRGEAELRVAGEVYRLRPSFAALVEAEAELGPLFALTERAAAGGLRLDEIAALLWHCIDARPDRRSAASGVLDQRRVAYDCAARGTDSAAGGRCRDAF